MVDPCLDRQSKRCSDVQELCTSETTFVHLSTFINNPPSAAMRELVWSLRSQTVSQSKRRLGAGKLIPCQPGSMPIQAIGPNRQAPWRTELYCQSISALPSLMANWGSLNGNHRLNLNLYSFLSPFINLMWSWCMKSHKIQTKCQQHLLEPSKIRICKMLPQYFFYHRKWVFSLCFTTMSLIMLQC